MENTFWAMDTYVRVRAYGVSEKRFEKIKKELQEVAAYVEEKLNFHSPSSALARLNSSGRSGDPFIFSAVLRALEISRLTHGAYDPTVASVEVLWDFEKGVIPEENQIKSALKFVGFGKVRLNNGAVELPEGVKLDLGGIAKGIFLDMAYKIFLQEKTPAVLDAGGEILLCGSPSGDRPDKSPGKVKPWRVAIRNPRGQGFVGIIELQKGFTWFIATSGDYERFFIKNGVRYHHVLDPTTGKPARYAVSATVVATAGYVADAVATALMVSPPDFLKKEPLRSMIVEAYVYREGVGLKKLFY